MATFFFFLASGVVISILKPGPTEAEVMKFMMGMMSAMDKSIMGLAMGIEHSNELRTVITLSISIFPLIIVASIIIGFIIRFINWRRNDV